MKILVYFKRTHLYDLIVVTDLLYIELRTNELIPFFIHPASRILYELLTNL